MPTYYPTDALELVQFRTQYHHQNANEAYDEHMHVIVHRMVVFDQIYFPIVVQMLNLRIPIARIQHPNYNL